jgi:SAM-dependent methyltransferase/ribosomal protein S27AE
MTTKLLAPDPATACRHCPSCGAVSTMSHDQELWPPEWTCGACGASLPTARGFPSLAPALDEAAEGIDLENFALLAEIEARNFWFLGRNEIIRWLIDKYAPRARRALEVGCGSGIALGAMRDALPGAKIAGSELHSRGLEIARKRHGGDVELFQMDARDARLSDALDVIGAFDVLEHVAEDQEVLGEVARMLKSDGILIATVPQHPWMWSTSDDLAHHLRRYRRGELAAKARAAGLHPIYESSFVTLAFPMMAMSRVLDRMRSRKLSLAELCAKQFQISDALNAILLSICKLEHWLRRAGVPLPFGGTQILVARRVPAGRKGAMAEP